MRWYIIGFIGFLCAVPTLAQEQKPPAPPPATVKPLQPSPTPTGATAPEALKPAQQTQQEPALKTLVTLLGANSANDALPTPVSSGALRLGLTLQNDRALRDPKVWWIRLAPSNS